MRIASQALAIERQASAQSALAERVSKPKTRATLGFMRLNFLSVRSASSGKDSQQAYSVKFPYLAEQPLLKSRYSHGLDKVLLPYCAILIKVGNRARNSK